MKPHSHFTAAVMITHQNKTHKNQNPPTKRFISESANAETDASAPNVSINDECKTLHVKIGKTYDVVLAFAMAEKLRLPNDEYDK